jgi:hypothetical protein
VPSFFPKLTSAPFEISRVAISIRFFWAARKNFFF